MQHPGELSPPVPDAARTASSERSVAVDIVRALGIVAVVASHVWSAPAIRQLTFTWAVPAFFFLSGYLSRPGRSPRAEAGRRWRTLGVPYLSWLVIFGVPALVLAAMNGTFGDQVLDLVLGGNRLTRPFTTFWFMSAFFIAAVVLRLLERLPRVVTWTVALAAVAAGTYASAVVAAVPLSAGVGLGCMVFVLAGQEFRARRQLIRRPAVVGAVLLLICGFAVRSGVSAVPDLKHSDYGTPVVSILVAIGISAGLLLVAEAAVTFVPRRRSVFVTELAVVGRPVILAHAAVLWLLDTPANGRWWEFALALVVPWMLALVLHRTPASPFLVGVPRRRPSGSR